MIVTIAWTEEGRKFVKEGQWDIGRPHEFEDVTVPKAVVWANSGSAAEIDKAKNYIKSYSEAQNAHVFTYPESEQDPLGRARKDVLEAVAKAKKKAEKKIPKPMKFEASIKKRASKQRSERALFDLKDSLVSASMEELLEDGPNWTFARRGKDVYRVAFHMGYDSGFRFECTMAHWLAHQPYKGNH